MNRRSYVNRLTLRRDVECHWCHRTGQDVIAPNQDADIRTMGRPRYECVNTRKCMQERTIRATLEADARRAQRAAERAALEAQAPAAAPAAGLAGELGQGVLFGQLSLFGDVA